MTLNDPAPRSRRFLSRREQARRYNKSTKTIERWGENPAMGMPAEYAIGREFMRDESELENWERTRVGSTKD